MEFKRIALSRNGFNRETKTAERKRKVVYTYWLFAVVRILLCLVPQNGYIHPDEFFQSIEPISGIVHFKNVIFCQSKQTIF